MAGEARADPASAIRAVNPDALAKPGGHYSHALVANGFVFVSGQLPITFDGTKLTSASFEEQTLQVLVNLKAALDAAGSSIDKLVQVRVYVDDIGNWPAFDALYRHWVGPHLPARAVVPVSGLHFNFKIEIEAVAILG